VVSDANTLLTPFLPHAAQQVHELLGGSGVWAAQPQLRDVTDDDGSEYPVLTGDYAAEQATWRSIPIEVGRPLAKPTPLFAKLDPKLADTGPTWAPVNP
jgi:methionyl-tRNA synthetase